MTTTPMTQAVDVLVSGIEGMTAGAAALVVTRWIEDRSPDVIDQARLTVAWQTTDPAGASWLADRLRWERTTTADPWLLLT